MSSINLRELMREVIAEELRPLIREQLVGELATTSPVMLVDAYESEPPTKKRRKRKTPANRLARKGGNFWTRAQRKYLVDKMLEGASMKQCADMLGRTVESIDGRLRHKDSGLFVGGLFGNSPIYVRAIDGSRCLDIDAFGNVAVMKDSSSGYVTREDFIGYFKHRM
jgi:hypothetical protein